jgi:hypothetical protein
MHACALVAIKMAEARTDFIFDGFGRLFGWMLLMSIVVLRGRLDDFLISIVVGGWMLMKLADMSSVSMLERLDVLYIIRPKIDAPYAAVSWWIN